jgi:hypothetical protein
MRLVPTIPVGTTDTPVSTLSCPTPVCPAWSEPSRSCSLGVDREQLIGSQHLSGSLQRSERAAWIVPIDCDHPEGGQDIAGLPAVEIVDLADKTQAPPDRHGERDVVEERQVVGGDDRRTTGWKMLVTFDV